MEICGGHCIFFYNVFRGFSFSRQMQIPVCNFSVAAMFNCKRSYFYIYLSSYLQPLSKEESSDYIFCRSRLVAERS